MAIVWGIHFSSFSHVSRTVIVSVAQDDSTKINFSSATVSWQLHIIPRTHRWLLLWSTSAGATEGGIRTLRHEKKLNRRSCLHTHIYIHVCQIFRSPKLDYDLLLRTPDGPSKSVLLEQLAFRVSEHTAQRASESSSTAFASLRNAGAHRRDKLVPPLPWHY